MDFAEIVKTTNWLGKGSKRPKRPEKAQNDQNDQSDQIENLATEWLWKRPIWSQTTKNGNTA